MTQQNRLSNLIEELRRRRVFRVAAFYGGIAVVIVGIVPDTFALMAIPAWISRMVIILLFLGFPIAMILAWVFDITPDGIVRTTNRLEPITEGEKGEQVKIKKGMTTVLLLIVGIIAIGAFLRKQSIKEYAARESLIPRINELADLREWFEANRLALLAEEVIPNDPLLLDVWPTISRVVNIHSNPPGASVYVRHHNDPDTVWQMLGKTPIDSIRFKYGPSHIRLEKEGFTRSYRILTSSGINDTEFKLHPLTKLNAEMNWIEGGIQDIGLTGLTMKDSVYLSDYWLSRHEVTNAEYLEFVQADGYRKTQYWREPFVRDGSELSADSVIASFVDQTGLPGPSTWISGSFPPGKENHPVGGLSWYEALAYTEYVAKSLPTVAHWSKAANPGYTLYWLGDFGYFGYDDSRDVGSFDNVGMYGSSDLAGNIREWVWNGDGSGGKYILGGGWDDDAYMYSDAYTQSAFDRSATNGFRTATYKETVQNLRVIGKNYIREFRDYMKENPVDDETFDKYRSMYSYAETPLNSVIERIDSSGTDWIKERITFDAAYNNDRVIASFYKPQNSKPPYQTIVYFPGSNAIFTAEENASSNQSIRFLIKTGRAVLVPNYKSTYERQDDLKTDVPNGSKFYRDHVIMWSQDLRRSIDYLETRDDIDLERLGYYGISWGGMLGGIMVALEPRISLTMLYIGGLSFEQTLPEVDLINFLPRVSTPVLMLNGRNDHFFPLATSQMPMMGLLGTEDEDKKHYVYDTGHSVPQVELIKEISKWLNKYFGKVNQAR